MSHDEYELARLYKELAMITATMAMNRKIYTPDEAIRFNEKHIKRIEEIDNQILMMESL